MSSEDRERARTVGNGNNNNNNNNNAADGRAKSEATRLTMYRSQRSACRKHRYLLALCRRRGAPIAPEFDSDVTDKATSNMLAYLRTLIEALPRNVDTSYYTNGYDEVLCNFKLLHKDVGMVRGNITLVPFKQVTIHEGVVLQKHEMEDEEGEEGEEGEEREDGADAGAENRSQRRVEGASPGSRHSWGSATTRTRMRRVAHDCAVETGSVLVREMLAGLRDPPAEVRAKDRMALHLQDAYGTQIAAGLEAAFTVCARTVSAKRREEFSSPTNMMHSMDLLLALLSPDKDVEAAAYSDHPIQCSACLADVAHVSRICDAGTARGAAPGDSRWEGLDIQKIAHYGPSLAFRDGLCFEHLEARSSAT